MTTAQIVRAREEFRLRWARGLLAYRAWMPGDEAETADEAAWASAGAADGSALTETDARGIWAAAQEFAGGEQIPCPWIGRGRSAK